ncbi:MAG: HEAT repeat domain-containing protein [Nitrospiraceae bacterium]
MSDEFILELLWTALLWEGAIMVFALAMLFGHALWIQWEAQHYAADMASGRTALTRALGTGALAPEDSAALRRLPLNRQVGLVHEWGTNLSGRGADIVGALSEQLGLMRAAERMCRSWWWSRRVRGVRILTVLVAGNAIVPPMFQDRSPVVRAQVAYWAASHPTPASIEALLAMLSDPDRFCRFAAMDALHRMGTVVIDPLVQFVTTQDGPQVDLAMSVISVMGDEHFLHVAKTMIVAERAVTRAFAAKVLGAVGGVGHLSLLLDRCADPVATVREAAVTAVGNLGHWPAAPRVAKLLGDPEWIVRHAAALALRNLGAPGRLFLRQALKGTDRYAVDMARHVLGLPMPGQTARAA